MRRSLAAATIIASLSLAAFPASAAPAGHVVLVTIDGTLLSDWRSPSLHAMARVLRDGAVGLLSTRTADNAVAAAPARAAAYRTLGSGRTASTADAHALAAAGHPMAVVASRGSPASSMVAPGDFVAIPPVHDPSLPGDGSDLHLARELVAGALRTARVTVADLGDTAAVDAASPNDPARRDAAMRMVMSRIDTFVGKLRNDLGPADTLIVASLTPPGDRRATRRYLSAIAMVGPGIRPGLLTSPSTERTGVVTIADIAPSILQRLGISTPTSMTGRPMHVVPDAHALTVTGLERDLIHASVLRSTLLRGTVYMGSVAIALALALIVAGVSGGAASALRAALDAVMIGTTAVPLLLMLQPLAGNWSLTTTAFVIGVVAIVGAAFLRAILGSRRALTAIFAVTALVVLGDLITGGNLAERSPLSYLIVEGARFHGIGNEAMGVVIAAALLWVAGVLDRGPTRERLTASVAMLALVAIVMAAPQIGDKFGSIPAAIPAFALFAMLAAGRRFDARAALGIAVVTVLAAGVVVALDRIGGGTHISRAVVGGGGEILGRKAGAAGRLLALSYWTTAIIAAAVSVGVIAWRRTALIGRGLWGRPATRAALVACGVAIAGSIAVNDAGVIAAAWISLFGGATIMSAMLTPDRR